jgi:hypothetical protein
MQDKIEGKTGTSQDHLPYLVELTTSGGGRRLLAKAESAALARAIFEAAVQEHPSEHLTLRNGSTVLAESASAQSPSTE